MGRSRLERLASLSGVLAVAIFVAAILVFPDEIPNPDEGAAKAVEFWRDNDGAAKAQALLFALAAIPFLWFGGSLRAHLRAREGAAGRVSSIAFGATVVFAAGLATGAALQFALAESADEVSTTTIETLNAINYNFFFPYAVGIVTLLLAVAVAALRHRAVHRAFAWTAILLAIVGVTPAGFVAFIVSGVWIVALSVVLYLEGARSPTAPASSPGSPS